MLRYDLSCNSLFFFFSSKTVTAEQKRSFLSPDAQHSVTCLLLHSPDSWQDNTLFQKVSSHTHSSPFSVTKPQTTTTVATVVARLLVQSLPLYICCCHYNRWNIFPWASSWYASSSVSLWLARQVNPRIALGDSEFPMSGVMRCPIYITCQERWYWELNQVLFKCQPKIVHACGWQ